MKTKTTHAQALRLANQLITQLRPACRRIAIAGSLRRQCPQIGDIELVAIPVIEQHKNLLGEVIAEVSLVDTALARFNLIKNGSKYKQFTYHGMTVDLFLQPDPATWGMNFTIRTGSQDFTHWLVTRQANGGAMPNNMRSKDARLWQWDDGQWLVLETPEEEDVFRIIGLEFIPPEQRDRGRWNGA